MLIDIFAQRCFALGQKQLGLASSSAPGLIPITTVRAPVLGYRSSEQDVGGATSSEHLVVKGSGGGTAFVDGGGGGSEGESGSSSFRYAGQQ